MSLYNSDFTATAPAPAPFLTMSSPGSSQTSICPVCLMQIFRFSYTHRTSGEQSVFKLRKIIRQGPVYGGFALNCKSLAPPRLRGRKWPACQKVGISQTNNGPCHTIALYRVTETHTHRHTQTHKYTETHTHTHTHTHRSALVRRTTGQAVPYHWFILYVILLCHQLL